MFLKRLIQIVEACDYYSPLHWHVKTYNVSSADTHMKYRNVLCQIVEVLLFEIKTLLKKKQDIGINSIELEIALTIPFRNNVSQ